MVAAVQTDPQPAAPSSSADDMIHTFCPCTPDDALCGFHDPGDRWIEVVDPAECCPVCTGLERLPCPRCQR